MIGYSIVNLDLLLSEYETDKVKKILSDFECPRNPDVEGFLKDKAEEFSKQGIAKTHLVVTSYKEENKIAGYFALSGSKSFIIKARSSAISSNLRRRIKRFGTYNEDLKQYEIPAPLIGQLGKNMKYPDLISGDELLELACKTIADVQLVIGGKFVYLECENSLGLLNFYGRNGFVVFGERLLDPEEQSQGLLKGGSLVQLLKYL